MRAYPVRTNKNPLGWAKTYRAQIVQSYTEDDKPIIHLCVRRHDDKPVRANWNVLQQIKNEMVGEDVTMVEVYPPRCEVVNEANVRHFWQVEPLPFGLHILR
jgi:hypothetical protein